MPGARLKGGNMGAMKKPSKKSPAVFEIHETTKVQASLLNPAAYNPRKITAEKFEALKESIRGDGFIEPLVVQKAGTRIIGGHQRLKAIKELCVEASAAIPDIPCVVLDIGDKAAKRLNIKLNKIQGEFEAKLLGELLVDLYEDSTPLPVDDFASLGFDPSEAEKFIRMVEPDLVPISGAGQDSEPFARSITLSVEFETVVMRDKVKKLLDENQKTAQRKTGDLVATALGLK